MATFIDEDENTSQATEDEQFDNLAVETEDSSEEQTTDSYEDEDEEYVKDTIRKLEEECKVTFVSSKYGLSDWEEMLLMSLCKHHIIANSTFSWWGAWMNQNENKQ